MTQSPANFSTQFWASFTAQRPPNPTTTRHIDDGLMPVKVVDVLDEEWFGVVGSSEQ
jgi:hypothetical protein